MTRHILRAACCILAVAGITRGVAAQMIPGDAEISAAVGDQIHTDIAMGGGMFLAVWSDARASVSGGLETETARDIYGIRLDNDGNLLDAVPIAIAAPRASQDNPKVAWNGTNWLVVFESYDLNGTGYYYQKSMEAVRVSPSGEVLDAVPIKLYGLTPSGGGYWALASDGDNWVVANQGSSTSGNILAVRISPEGVLLDPPTRTLVEATYYMRSNLKLAYSAGVFLLTFDDDYVNGTNDTKAVRFDSDLNVLGGLMPLLTTPLSDLGANGSGFYIVWHRQEPNFSVVVAGSRVNTMGQRLDGNGVNISGTVQPYAYASTAVAWDGLNWTVTWGEFATTWVARVNAAGALLAPGSVVIPGTKTGPSAGSGSGGVQLVWEEYANNNNDVFSARITPSNASIPAGALSIGSPRQQRSDVATSGSGYMLVYASATANQVRILAQPLDAAGNPLTADPIELDAGSPANAPTYPHIAWNGTCYLAAWGNASGIVGQRLLPDGTKLDAEPVVVMSAVHKAFGSADVAALNGDFLVVGRQIGINIQYIFPAAARVRGSDGAVLDSAPLVLGGSYVGRIPAVVTLGNRWLAAWHRNSTHDSPSASTMGAFVNPDGTFLPPFTIHGGFSTAGGNGIFELALCANETIALMVQSQELSSSVETDLLARLIDVNGNQYRPQIAWDGAHFIVAYQEQKTRLADWTLDQLDARSDLFAMRVDPTGAVLDPDGFVFSASPYGETDPNLAARDGMTLLTGSVVINDAGHANYRIIYQQRGADGNKWPVAMATAVPATGDVPISVAFSSAGSSDADGAIVSYFWDFGDGTSATNANPSHTYVDPGPFVARLTVTDDEGASTTQTALVKVVAPNQLPVAVATASTYAGALPLDVVLYAAGSYDPDGFIGNIEWLFSDGGSYWGSPAYHTFTQPGPQTVTLRCYDARGGVGTTTLIINDVGVNMPPVAIASATPTSGFKPLAVQFSMAGSYDPDGTLVAHQWTFGDGSGASSTEASPFYTYVATGTYTATLTVWDNQNDSHSATVDISVVSAHHVEYGVNLSLGPIYVEHYEQGEEPVGPIDHEEVIPDYGRVAGTTNVGFGVNKARVELAGTNEANPLNFEYGFATSRYWDSFQFDNPQLNGTLGSFEATLFVAGSGFVELSDGYQYSPDTEFDAFWHAVINVSAEGVTDPFGSPIQSAYYAGQWYKGFDSSTLDYTGDPLNTDQQTVVFQFIYGQPILMDTFLQVDTRFDNQISSVAGTMDTVIDLGNSSYWGGISNLRDAQGNLVTSVTYSSSSGFDYRQPALFLAAPGQEAQAPTFGPTSMVMAAGETATIEVWIARTDPRLLGGFQVALPAAAVPSADAAGTVSYVDTAGSGGSVLINTADPDWVFSAAGSVIPEYNESLPDGFAMQAALPAGGVIVNEPAYLGEFQFEASADAGGVFTLEFLPLGAAPNAGTGLFDDTQTSQITANHQPFTITVVPGGGECLASAAECADLDSNGIRDDNCVWWECAVGTCNGINIVFADMGGSFGACTPDGTADGNDRFHALNCFSNTSTTGGQGYPCEEGPPQAYNVDAGGPFGDCAPDGVCDGNDAFHALNAFQGSTTCSCPSGPSPAAPQSPAVVAQAGIRLEAARQRIQPEDTVAVDVMLAGPLPDLRGYQLHLGVRGGKTGALDLAYIAVHARKDRAFAGLADWQAFNVETGQMVAGLDTAGVETLSDAYLATFVFRASADAGGTFIVDLLHDDTDPAQRTFLFPTPASGKIAIDSVTPAVVTVQQTRSRTR
jgi:PKD repeat protein